MASPFLSDTWLQEARSLRAEYQGKVSAFGSGIRMNLVVNDVPFGPGTIDAHLDTGSGDIDLDLGHLDSPDLTLTVDYATAKSILVDANQQAAMQAFMAGKITVAGDMTKLMALQFVPSDGRAVEMAERLRDMTE